MKLEAELLPHKDLKPLHDKAIWLYVYQTFKSDAAGRTADRMALRFSVTSWPQLMLADPGTLEVLTHTGRSVRSFQEAFARAKPSVLSAADAETAMASLARAEEVARTLKSSRKPDPDYAESLLHHADIVVKMHAIEVLAAHKPDVILKQAKALLATPNDSVRYLICKTLGVAGDSAAAPHLEALVASPAPSRNPNVLRIRAVQALATCGRPASVKIVAPYAVSGVYFNGMTGIAVGTLAALAAKYSAIKPEVERTLRTGYPSVAKLDLATPGGTRALRAATGLARRIHKALADPRPFPSPYDEASRKALMQPPAAAVPKGSK